MTPHTFPWEFVGGVFDGTMALGDFRLDTLYYWHYTVEAKGDLVARTVFYQPVACSPKLARPHLVFVSLHKGLLTVPPRAEAA